jgi:hypothetical protein
MPTLTRLPSKPAKLSHDEIVALTLRLRGEITPARVSRLFLASLSTRRLDWRSILGSYAVCLHLPKHAAVGKSECDVCTIKTGGMKVSAGEYDEHRAETCGGIMHPYVHYALGDLNYSLDLPEAQPTKEDIAALQSAIDALRALPTGAGLGACRDSLNGLFKANKHERQVFLEILAYCGILRSPGIPNYFLDFVNYDDRDDPSGMRAEWCFPMSWWYPQHGVHADALKFWFPEIK